MKFDKTQIEVYVKKAHVLLNNTKIFLKEKLHSYFIISALTVAVFIFGFIPLVLMRTLADPYQPVSSDFTHILLSTIGWVTSLLIYAAFVFKLHFEKPLTGVNAFLFVLATCELVSLSVQTYTTYSYVPRDHGADERASVDLMIKQLNQSLPIKLNDDIVEKLAFRKGHVLVLLHDIKNITEHNWNRESLAPQLKAQACDYLTHFSQYKTLLGVSYSFGGEDKSINVSYRIQDCTDNPSAPASSPTIQGGQS